ncbi:peptidoglycan DD-metalloendopeptidase family protein [Rasiella sp. SM2506]|uniref:peptidoglycan DD-metalloendopeptidase family protein n=1 Tax=Rasiella sp. SM2506 TaxID=3423914 RepID=UPI003D7B49D1
MKNFIVLLLLSFTTTFVYSQNEKNVLALTKLQDHYNAGNNAAVHDMLSERFQQQVSAAAMHQLLSTFQKNFGNFTSFIFMESQGGRDTFLGNFENGQQNIGIYVDEDTKIAGLLFKPVENNEPAKFERNTTQLRLPFTGEWMTYWGGTKKAQNYHVTVKVQQGAFDFVKLGKNNSSYQRSGTRNEDYYAFGQPLFAVCDAEVYEVNTGVEDNRPSIMNPAQPLGNSVMLKTANDEYIVYAHLEYGTVAVKAGDIVTKGQYLGNCGNSGNSSEAHLHLHIQDGPNVMTAAGARCYFEKVLVNGALQTDYSPVKYDRVSLPEN